MYQVKYSNYCDKRFIEYEEINSAIQNEILIKPLKVGIDLNDNLKDYLVYKGNLKNEKDGFRIVYKVVEDTILILSIGKRKRFYINPYLYLPLNKINFSK